MNYVIFTVKVIKNLGQSFFADGTSLTELTVQLPQVRKNNTKIIFQVSIWGKLSYDVAKYYQPEDYIIIEGYISIRSINIDRIVNLFDQQIEISVFKLYPLLLKS
jgi:single-stranded DNA-binding protein